MLLRFSSGSTVLFQIRKNHYMAIHFWKNDSNTYYYDYIINPTIPDLYIHLGQVIFHTTEFFSLSSILMSMDSAILVLSNIQEFYRLMPTCFFLLLFSGWLMNAKLEYIWWLPNTSIDITINHFHCIVIISRSSSCLFILRSERDWCVLLVLNISNIGLGLIEIIQLTCVASWLAGFCMVYPGFTWYISDE